MLRDRNIADALGDICDGSTVTDEERRAVMAALTGPVETKDRGWRSFTVTLDTTVLPNVDTAECIWSEVPDSVLEQGVLPLAVLSDLPQLGRLEVQWTSSPDMERRLAWASFWERVAKPLLALRLRRLARADYEQMPWKNGKGITEQIAISPPGASVTTGFTWRVSTALVAGAGPFSSFAGYDRVLVVMEGDGLSITRGRECFFIAPLVPFRFSGDDAIEATLTGAPIRDFNVIFKRGGEVNCDVIELRAEAALPAGGHPQLVTCARGGFSCGGLRLFAGDTLAAIDGRALRLYALEPESVVVHVRIA